MTRFKTKIYLDKKGKWRWKITARNGRIIGASTQGYNVKSSCKRNMDDVMWALEDWMAAEYTIA